MQTLKANLQKRLNRAKRVAILGVGSELRGDDGAGMLVAKELSQFLVRHKCQRRARVFFGETAPENLTGEIKKFLPTHIIIIDSADISKTPGAIKIIEAPEVSGVSFCTHQLPLKILTGYLMQSVGSDVFIIGIQPKQLDFNAPVSKEVKEAIRAIVSILKEILT